MGQIILIIIVWGYSADGVQVYSTVQYNLLLIKPKIKVSEEEESLTLIYFDVHTSLKIIKNLPNRAYIETKNMEMIL